MVAEIAVGVALGIGMCALVGACIRWIERKEHPILGGIGILMIFGFAISIWIESRGLPASWQWIPEAFASDY